MAHSFQNDLAFSFRTLMRRPGFALLAVLTVALGIGVNAAMFTIVNGVLWKPQPYPDSDRLVMFNETSGATVLNVSAPNLEDWRKRSAAFEDIAYAREFPPVTLQLEQSKESVITGYTHPKLFALLGVKPALGRLFTSEDDIASAEPVGVITDRAWQRYFGGDPKIIGQRIRASVSFLGKSTQSVIIGAVMPPGFRFENIDLWLPINPFWNNIDPERGNHWFRGLGKLKRGATLQQGLKELDAIARDLEQQYPSTNKDVRVRGAFLNDYYAAYVRRPLLVLFGAVGFVMLIACGNVVHLLLTRTLARRREIAVRLALGAAPGRLLQLLLSESLLIALAGGAAGVLLANWAVAWTLTTQPRLLPRAQTIHVDSTAILYAAAMTVATFAILGLTPLWQTSRASLVSTLQSAGRGGMDRGRQRLGWGMIAAELGMASILLAGAGLMIQTLHHLSQVQLGYQPDGVISVSVGAEKSGILTERILEELRGTPGLVASAYAEPFGIGGNGMLPYLNIPGRANPKPAPMIPTMSVSRDFFQTMHIPLRSGRYFTPNGAGHEGIVNEEFVRRFFPNENPLGRRIEMGWTLEIVGVVASTRLQGPLRTEQPEVYWSSNTWGSPALLMRFDGKAETAAALRERLRQISPEIRIGAVTPLASLEEGRTAVPRFTRSLLGVFAGLAVLLAALGIYGVVSYSVAQRTREIGIRMALGASRPNVARLVLQQTLIAAAAGAAIGLAGAVALSRFIATQLYGVTPREPSVYVAAGAVIAVVAFGASAVPMLRAARIDPAVCLREE